MTSELLSRVRIEIDERNDRSVKVKTLVEGMPGERRLGVMEALDEIETQDQLHSARVEDLKMACQVLPKVIMLPDIRSREVDGARTSLEEVKSRLSDEERELKKTSLTRQALQSLHTELIWGGLD